MTLGLKRPTEAALSTTVARCEAGRHSGGMQDDETRLGDDPETLNPYERKLVQDVRDHGWRSVTAGADGGAPSFSYTTGFWRSLAAPEVIVFDFPLDLAHDVFGQMYRLLRAGPPLPVGQRIEGVLSGESIFLLPADPVAAADFLLSSRWFYKDAEYPCVQLVWADRAGLFPWQEGFAPGLADLQPDLSRRAWAGLAG